MFCTEQNETKSRLDLAKEALIKLVSIMNEENDRLSLITFNQKTEKIFGLLNKSEIQKNHLQKLNNINAGGGTNLLDAGIASLDNLNLDQNNNKKRELFLSPMLIMKIPVKNYLILLSIMLKN